jgi:dual-specificity kinase
MLCVGTFGRVLECWDRKLKDYVAVKIVRNVDKYRHAAMIEVGSMVLTIWAVA